MKIGTYTRVSSGPITVLEWDGSFDDALEIEKWGEGAVGFNRSTHQMWIEQPDDIPAVPVHKGDVILNTGDEASKRLSVMPADEFREHYVLMAPPAPDSAEDKDEKPKRPNSRKTSTASKPRSRASRAKATAKKEPTEEKREINPLNEVKPATTVVERASGLVPLEERVEAEDRREVKLETPEESRRA